MASGRVEVSIRDVLAARLDLGVFGEVLAERARQDEKWGEQNLPDVHQPVLTAGRFRAIAAARYYGLPTSAIAKRDTDDAAAAGRLTYAHIAVEELTEAIEAAADEDTPALRTELVQLAAVCVQWVQAIDRRRPAATS